MTARTTEPGVRDHIGRLRRRGDQPVTLLTALRALDPARRITVVTPGPVRWRIAADRWGSRPSNCRSPPRSSALGESGASDRRGAERVDGCASRRAVGGAGVAPGSAALRRVLREAAATVVHSNGLKAHVAGGAGEARGHAARVAPARLRPQPPRVGLRCCGGWRGEPTRSSPTRTAFCADASDRHPHRRRAAASTTRSTQPSRRTVLRLDLAERRSAETPASCESAWWRRSPAGRATKCSSTPSRASPAVPRARIHHRRRAVYETAGSQWSRGGARSAKATERGLSGIVGFTGHVDDVPSALRSLDIVVHASTRPSRSAW